MVCGQPVDKKRCNAIYK